MDDVTVSRTALATSLMRAAHTRLDPTPLIDDPWGDRLVPASVRESMPDSELLKHRAYSNVITRTRYTEDALRAAVAKGVRQYVLIGAGLDSFALRRPGFARDVEIFEIDHPATQGFKLGRFKDLGLTVTGPAHFIAADLGRQSVAAALGTAPFHADRLTFFSWLGVTMYLTREANLATLRSVASCSAAGSELAFTYMDAAAFDSPSESFQEMRRRVAALGEPFLSGFDPAQLLADLGSCGLELIEDLAGDQAAARYEWKGSSTAPQSSLSHIALARVT